MTKKKQSYGAKKPRVLEMLAIYPDKSDAHIANMVGCHPGYVKQLRVKTYAEEDKSLKADGLIARVTTPLGFTPEEMQELTYSLTSGTGRTPPQTDDITQVLEERGSRYGAFISHAMITQLLKGTMNTYLTQNNKTLMPDQQEALDMIFHKIGRILNGDPNYADSWVDIAGYAKLVADRLGGVSR